MTNISLNGEDLKFKVGIYYYVIDALYINQIKKEQVEIYLDNNFDEYLKTNVFPYTDTPFAKVRFNKEVFEISLIQRADYNDYIINDLSYFSTDSGLLVVVNEKYFKRFINNFDYNKLTDSIQDDINNQYWMDIISDFEELDIALILAPGINTQFDFNGSGLYRIIG